MRRLIHRPTLLTAIKLMKSQTALIRRFAGLFLLLAALSPAVATAQPSRTAYEIAFVTAQNKGGVYVMREDGSGARLVVQEKLATLSPTSWSPDGQRLAYFGIADSDADIASKHDLPFHFPLYLINADGSGRERLLDIPVVPWLRWSPDGSHMLFVSGAEDPSRNLRTKSSDFVPGALYVLDVKSKTYRRLTEFLQRYLQSGSWSPDSRHIMVTSGSGTITEGIVIVDLQGNIVRKLTGSAARGWNPEWSPRGDRVAYMVWPRAGEAEGQSGVFIANTDGSDARHVWRVPHHNFTWSPDGSLLLIGSSSPALINADSGAATRLTQKEAIQAVFAPTGRSILYRLREATEGRTLIYGLYASDVAGQNEQRLHGGVSTFSVSPLLR